MFQALINIQTGLDSGRAAVRSAPGCQASMPSAEFPIILPVDLSKDILTLFRNAGKAVPIPASAGTVLLFDDEPEAGASGKVLGEWICRFSAGL